MNEPKLNGSSHPHTPVICATCPAFIMSNDGRTGNCHGNVPVPFILAGPRGPDGQPIPRTVGIFPPVLPSEWCAKHPLFVWDVVQPPQPDARPISPQLSEDVENTEILR